MKYPLVFLPSSSQTFIKGKAICLNIGQALIILSSESIALFRMYNYNASLYFGLLALHFYEYKDKYSTYILNK